MLVNVEKPKLELVLKSAEADYNAIKEAMNKKGIFDPNSIMAFKKLSSLIFELGAHFSGLTTHYSYISGIKELEDDIRLSILLLRMRIDNYDRLSEEELKYARLSVCPNGHCYEHEEKGCPFCWERGFVDVIYSNVQVFKKMLYIGKLEDSYILTDDENIENKIDEIEVGFNPSYKSQGFNISYKFYYRIKSSENNVSDYSGIRIGNLFIRKKELIKMCDKIVDRKQKNISINMEKYNCPKCNTAFIQGTKFCQYCGCNLEKEFIENPVCPKCNKRFSAGTRFCEIDGSTLVSPGKLIPKCIKCGKEYPAEIKYCPADGAKVIPEALRNSLSGIKEIISIVSDIETVKNSNIKSLLVFTLAIASTILNLFVIFGFFSHSHLDSADFVGGEFNFFVLYLKNEVMGWIITVVILSGIAKFIDEVYVENEDKMSKTGALIASISGGLALVFLILGLFSKIIVGA